MGVREEAYLAALLLLLLVYCPTSQGKKVNSGKNRKGHGSVLCMTAADAEKGIQLDCRHKGQGQGHIVGLSVMGVAEACEGLTAHLFVQMNSCLWKETCVMKKHQNDKYNVKLYKGLPEVCILTPSQYYTVIYKCSNPGVAVLDVLSDDTVESSDPQGIVRSHVDHPWLYRRHTNAQDGKLVLKRPPGTHNFVYTIQTLRLMHNDALKVTSGEHVRHYQHDIRNFTDVFTEEKAVTFELVTSPNSGGEEGFVICFQWLSGDMKTKDVCSELMKPGPSGSGLRPLQPKGCPERKKKNGKNGKESKKGKKKPT